MLTWESINLAALEMIHQAAGRGDQHIDAAIELLDLVVHRDAADQKRMAQLGVFAVGVEAFGNLVGQFAGRLQHQSARGMRALERPGQHLDHRQREARGLAGAGLGNADHVAPLQHNGNGLGLDRRRRGVAGVGNRIENFGDKGPGRRNRFGAGRRRQGCNFAGSGFRAGGRHLGRNTLLIGA